jgi:hypothetical protein
MDYQNGKIYSIRTPKTEKFYIGSTTQILCKRFADHKSKFKKNNCKLTSKYLFELGFDDCYIELIENYPCNNKEELTKREGELMRQYKEQLVNNRLESITIEEIKEKKQICDKRYYDLNKDKIKHSSLNYKLYCRTKYTCDCGSIICIGDKSTHNKSQKHTTFISYHMDIVE